MNQPEAVGARHENNTQIVDRPATQCTALLKYERRVSHLRCILTDPGGLGTTWQGNTGLWPMHIGLYCSTLRHHIAGCLVGRALTSNFIQKPSIFATDIMLSLTSGKIHNCFQGQQACRADLLHPDLPH